LWYSPPMSPTRPYASVRTPRPPSTPHSTPPHQRPTRLRPWTRSRHPNTLRERHVNVDNGVLSLWTTLDHGPKLLTLYPYLVPRTIYSVPL
jgi:hypothetical protein